MTIPMLHIFRIVHTQRALGPRCHMREDSRQNPMYLIFENLDLPFGSYFKVKRNHERWNPNQGDKPSWAIGLPPVPCTGRTVWMMADRRVGQHGNPCRLVETNSLTVRVGVGHGRSRTV